MVSCSWVCQLLKMCVRPSSLFLPSSVSFPTASYFALLSLNMDLQSLSIILRSAEDLSRLNVSLSVFLFEVLIDYFNHSLMFRSNTSTLCKVLETEPWKSTKGFQQFCQTHQTHQSLEQGWRWATLLCIIIQTSLDHLPIPLTHSPHFHIGLGWARVSDSPLCRWPCHTATPPKTISYPLESSLQPSLVTRM